MLFSAGVDLAADGSRLALVRCRTGLPTALHHLCDMFRAAAGALFFMVVTFYMLSYCVHTTYTQVSQTKLAWRSFLVCCCRDQCKRTGAAVAGYQPYCRVAGPAAGQLHLSDDHDDHFCGAAAGAGFLRGIVCLRGAYSGNDHSEGITHVVATGLLCAMAYLYFTWRMGREYINTLISAIHEKLYLP